MQDFIQTIIIGGLLIGALGFLVFKLSTSVKSVAMNKAPSCHGDGEEDCAHCAANVQLRAGKE